MSPFMGNYYNPELENLYPTNPDRARELLAEAGFPDGFSAVFRIVDNPLYHDIAAVIQSELQAVGIDLTIQPQPWNAFNEEVVRGRNYEISLLNVVGFADASRVLGRYRSTATNNKGNFVNLEVDRLLTDALASWDHSAATDMYHEVQRLLAYYAAAFWVIDPGVMVALSPEFTGFRNYPFAFTNISAIRFVD